MEATVPAPPWIPEDDLLLKNAIEVYSSPAILSATAFNFDFPIQLLQFVLLDIVILNLLNSGFAFVNFNDCRQVLLWKRLPKERSDSPSSSPSGSYGSGGARCSTTLTWRRRPLLGWWNSRRVAPTWCRASRIGSVVNLGVRNGKERALGSSIML